MARLTNLRFRSRPRCLSCPLTELIAKHWGSQRAGDRSGGELRLGLSQRLPWVDDRLVPLAIPPSAKISRAKAHVRFSRYRAASFRPETKLPGTNFLEEARPSQRGVARRSIELIRTVLANHRTSLSQVLACFRS